MDAQLSRQATQDVLRLIPPDRPNRAELIGHLTTMKDKPVPTRPGPRYRLGPKGIGKRPWIDVDVLLNATWQIFQAEIRPGESTRHLDICFRPIYATTAIRDLPQRRRDVFDEGPEYTALADALARLESRVAKHLQIELPYHLVQLDLPVLNLLHELERDIVRPHVDYHKLFSWRSPWFAPEEVTEFIAKAERLTTHLRQPAPTVVARRDTVTILG